MEAARCRAASCQYYGTAAAGNLCSYCFASTRRVTRHSRAVADESRTRRIGAADAAAHAVLAGIGYNAAYAAHAVRALVADAPNIATPRRLWEALVAANLHVITAADAAPLLRTFGARDGCSDRDRFLYGCAVACRVADNFSPLTSEWQCDVACYNGVDDPVNGLPCTAADVATSLTRRRAFARDQIAHDSS